LPLAPHDANQILQRPHGLASQKGYLNHLSYSLGSQAEVETVLEILKRRQLVPQPLLLKGVDLVEPVGKMLNGLIASLERTRDFANP